MSTISIKVELPGHSHSFVVEVLDTATVHGIKAEIAKVCPGGPRIEGQRLIYGGRALNNEEQIKNVWPHPQGSIIVHLAVHPSAWTSTPPDRQAPRPFFSPTPSTSNNAAPTYRSPPPIYPSSSPALFNPFSQHHHAIVPHHSTFIMYKHACAISVLTTNTYNDVLSSSPNVLEVSRTSAIQTLAAYGWSWPEIFDEPFPASNESEFAKYERVVIDGQLFLSLNDPNAKPSRLQLHAFKILSYTFTILSAPPPFPTPYFPHTPVAAQYPLPQGDVQNLNVWLQDMGLPQIRIAQNGLGGAQIRAFPLRALLAPMIMLSIRSLLLLYFFAPSKTPFFGLVLGAWITYEAWNAIQIILRPTQVRREQRDVPHGQGANGGAQQPNAQAQQGVPTSAQTRSHTGVVLDTLAHINLGIENDALSPADNARSRMARPSLIYKVWMFLTLMITTVHPALWNRRRAELVRREGRIRTDAIALQSEDGSRVVADGEVAVEAERRTQERARLREQHARRPSWVREYVERVRNVEYTDE